jgi:hypothetical protein
VQLGPLLGGQVDPERLGDGRNPSRPKLYDTYLRKCLEAVPEGYEVREGADAARPILRLRRPA